MTQLVQAGGEGDRRWGQGGTERLDQESWVSGGEAQSTRGQTHPGRGGRGTNTQAVQTLKKT